MSFKAPTWGPKQLMIEAARHGLYFNGKHARDDNYIYQNEIFTLDEDSKQSYWLYHGNPIAKYDDTLGTFFLDDCGWGDHISTRQRMNLLADGRFRYCRKKDRLLYNEEVYEAPTDEIQKEFHEIYHIIDGWRGYSIPILAVAGASDTGGWSDSPCPSSSVEEELKDLQNVYKKHGIYSYLAYTQSSNVFCLKRWVVVRGNQLKDAMKVEINFHKDYNYVHKA